MDTTPLSMKRSQSGEQAGVLASAGIEEARIREAYSRRAQNDARYSWFNPGYQFMIQGRERRILNQLSRYGCTALESKTILEVGCGTGQWLLDFIKWGARPENITGIDLLPDRASHARRVCPATLNIQCASAAQLPFSNESFDVVFQSTVFTSMLDDNLRHRAATEMVRVVKSNGLILWYDYHVNNPWNREVRAVTKRDIYRLFPECRIHLVRLTLLPPLARALAPYSYLACCLLEKFPPLCTHYLGIIRRL